MSNGDGDGDTSPVSPRSMSSISTTSTSASTTHPAFNILLGGRYRLVKRLGGGAFGEVFAGIELTTQEMVAIKLEPLVSHHQLHLQHEARLYAFLNRGVMTVGIPRVRWFGREGDFNVMAMDLLGPSLEELFEYCNRQFDIKTVCVLVLQMICRVEFLHAMCYLHRDLKPENFVMGTGRRAHHLYLIDMGLCKRYCDLKTREHIPYIEGKSLTGTARYVSINTHLGRQQARRDDLESLALIGIYLMKGNLPWQGIRAPNKQEKYEKIKAMKLRMPAAELCKELPKCFEMFLTYTRHLDFTDEPDYEACRKYFSKHMDANGLKQDYQYSWILKERSEQHLTESSDVGSPYRKSSRVRQKSKMNSSVVSLSGAESHSMVGGGLLQGNKSPLLFRSQEFKE